MSTFWPYDGIPRAIGPLTAGDLDRQPAPGEASTEIGAEQEDTVGRSKRVPEGGEYVIAALLGVPALVGLIALAAQIF